MHTVNYSFRTTPDTLYVLYYICSDVFSANKNYCYCVITHQTQQVIILIDLLAACKTDELYSQHCKVHCG